MDLINILTVICHLDSIAFLLIVQLELGLQECGMLMQVIGMEDDFFYLLCNLRVLQLTWCLFLKLQNFLQV